MKARINIARPLDMICKTKQPQKKEEEGNRASNKNWALRGEKKIWGGTRGRGEGIL